MNRGKRIFLFIFLAATVVIAVPILMQTLSTPSDSAVLAGAISTCKNISAYLIEYHGIISQENTDKPELTFVDYVQNANYKFTTNPPQDSFSSKYDIPIHLLLPKILESKFPQMIGFTGPIKEVNDKTYRVALFLNGTEINVVTLPNAALQKIIGKSILQGMKAEIYYSHRKTR